MLKHQRLCPQMVKNLSTQSYVFYYLRVIMQIAHHTSLYVSCSCRNDNSQYSQKLQSVFQKNSGQTRLGIPCMLVCGIANKGTLLEMMLNVYLRIIYLVVSCQHGTA